jgi:hypothetical protein
MTITHKSITLEVDYRIHKGEPEITTLSNGDPGTPGTADEVEIHALWYSNVYGDAVDVHQIYVELGYIEEIEQEILNNL